MQVRTHAQKYYLRLEKQSKKHKIKKTEQASRSQSKRQKNRVSRKQYHMNRESGFEVKNNRQHPLNMPMNMGGTVGQISLDALISQTNCYRFFCYLFNCIMWTKDLQHALFVTQNTGVGLWELMQDPLSCSTASHVFLEISWIEIISRLAST